MILFYQLLLGVILSGGFLVFAFFLRLLTFDGCLVAWILGTLIIGFGPWYSIFLVGFFFLSSGSIHLLKTLLFIKKEPLSSDTTRNARQVFANIFPAVSFLIVYSVTGSFSCLLAFVVGISGATSDTWASEIGTLASKRPRSILTGAKLPTGLSGGISPLGTFASLLGASAISFLFVFCLFLTGTTIDALAKIFVTCTVFGFLISIFDSLLGALFQVRYQCTFCNQLTDAPYHHGLPTKKVKGITWMTNNWVNFFSNLLGILFFLVFTH
ncbi:MAG: DUF92 domain-containing protein [Enterococcus sp.]